ncbi:hypothetical protein IE53DRAFT_78393 [Violaceomyces palustris]|uniref:Uncharacterized protein n=1 Tax=Violaceomyces palustris TaxID=1673888 RepID=A0ACD0NY75_9BASI|nr:hypothetical protein IE53DRAFT_78393 [Violaceomyces palustris]
MTQPILQNPVTLEVPAASTPSTPTGGTRTAEGSTFEATRGASIASTRVTVPDADEGDREKTAQYAPPASDGPFRWIKSTSSKKPTWYRSIDAMANFILHWQTRFHNHGDMYVSGLLKEKDKDGELRLIDINRNHVREALRRMRAVHPYVAVHIVDRESVGAEPIKLPATLKKLKLQVALAYEVPQSEDDIDEWLNRTLIVHDKLPPGSGLTNQSHEVFRDLVRQRSRYDVPALDQFRVHLWEADLGTGQPARIAFEDSHVTSDGLGMMLLADELFSFISLVLVDPTPAKIVWGPEVERLIPSLQDAFANPPETWHMTQSEIAKVDKQSRRRVTGKQGPPTGLEKFADNLLAFTLKNGAHEKKWRRTISKPLVKLVRSVAEKGDAMPVGLLPSAKEPYHGPWSHDECLTAVLKGSDCKRLLAALKSRGLTLAPFTEAAMDLATTWVRRERRIASGKDGYDAPGRILGSFSNAINRRDSLKPEYQRYVGLCMSGMPSGIPVSMARWSESADKNAVRWNGSPDYEGEVSSKGGEVLGQRSDEFDRVPSKIEREDLESVFKITKELSQQYRDGRENPNWLKHGDASLFGTMQGEYLLISNEAFYPSMPWLSSLGKVDVVIRPSRPIPSAVKHFDPSEFDSTKPTSDQVGSSDRSLEFTDFRLAGRTAIAQPIFHTFSFRDEWILNITYPEWLYDRKGVRGLKDQGRENSLKLWIHILRMIIHAAIDLHESEVSSPAKAQ